MHENYMDDKPNILEDIEIPFIPDADGLEGLPEFVEELEKRHERNRDIISKFLGSGPRAAASYNSADYYDHLLAWAVKRVTSSPGWEKISDQGYSFPQPFFKDIQTDYSDYESCLVNGQTLLLKESTRFVISISAGRIQIEAEEQYLESVSNLIQEIKDCMTENNIYKGKRIMLDGSAISFLNVEERLWDSIVLEPAMKRRIWENSIGFLENFARMKEYGIGPQMGICLSGEPGTGKTVITRALMAEAVNITCITTSPYSVLSGGYISELYELAQDLSPTILCIEDLDSVGMERNSYYHGTPAYLALLQEMDGLTEKTAIVTIGTTNLLKTIDAALLRPSRFGCTIQLQRPTHELRAHLVDNISKKIPLSQDVRAYILNKTSGFTPAEIQGVIHGMVISRISKSGTVDGFSREEVDKVISQMKTKKNGNIGFKS